MSDSNGFKSSGSATPNQPSHLIPSATSPLLSSSQFNRRPLSDTPIASHANSPREYPLAFPYQYGASGSGSLRSTPNSSSVNVPVLSISNNIDESASIQSASSSSSSLSSLKPASGPASSITSGDLDPTAPVTADPVTITPRTQRRATTLDVPGLTRSRVSPSGHISQRDVGSKLVIVMVGLPARGKSYLTNKLCRYLNWLQYDARIFNVGNTRRKASKNAGPAFMPLPANGPHMKVWNQPPHEHSHEPLHSNSPNKQSPKTTPNQPDSSAAHGSPLLLEVKSHDKNAADNDNAKDNENPDKVTEQTADFFSPDNVESFKLREQWAMDTLDDLLDYVITGPGSIGILDATNTTAARRKKVLRRIKERSDGQLKVLFVESICSDSRIIEKNIRLKLSGPDYKDSDKEVALNDFVGRMRNYEKVYQTLTEDEAESDSFQYVKMIDVGRKINTFNIKGFLAPDVVAFLLNFNLAERQIWITRHGESFDNAAGRIGGDSKLTPRGQKFSKALAKFIDHQKVQFRKNQLKQFAENQHFLESAADGSHLMAKSNDTKPIGPLGTDLVDEEAPEEPNFCVWTSMLRRSFESAACFNEDVYDIKEMRMLNELGAGICDGMTYPEIKATYPHEYQARMSDKISYRYPGPGGESYLDVINRIRPIIVEVERMTDNVLIIAHRVVCRILLAYFMNLGRDAIGDLDVPLHTLYCLEPKPYGVSWEAYEYDDKTDWFYRVPKETMLERGRHPSIAPQIAGRTRQFSVAPTDSMPHQSPSAYPHPAGPLSFSPGSSPNDHNPLTFFTASQRQHPFGAVSTSPPSASVPHSSIFSSVMGVNMNMSNIGTGAPGFAAHRGLNPMHSAASSASNSQSGSHPSSFGSTTSAETSPQQSLDPADPQSPSFSHAPYSPLPPISELSSRLNNLRKL